MIIRVLFVLAMGLFTPLCGFDQINGDLSLKPEPPPKPEVFGIGFGDDIRTVTERLGQLGLPLKNQRVVGTDGNARILTFSGIPRDIPVADGTTELLFFRNELIRMDFLIPPTYNNFLLVRNQLFYSMGKRFRLEHRKEVMEDMLRTSLADLQPEKRENSVRKSLVKGSTFYFYKLGDQRRELDVTYSFYSPPSSTGTPQPELRLHYSLAGALDEYKSIFRKKRKGPSKLLPFDGASR